MRFCSTAVTAFLLLLPVAASAQAIRGSVVDDESGEPIAGVALDVVRGNTVVATGQTGSDGSVVLSLRAAGRYSLRVTHPSYLPLTTAELSVGSDTVRIELRLGRTTIPLRPLVVEVPLDARMAGFYERMRRGAAGHFITQDRIEQRPGARTTDLLREVPGLDIVRVAGRNMVRIRGRATCNPTMFIDGIEVRQYPESGVDDFLRPEMLAGVEVYTGGNAPPPIEGRNACGVIAFWTRPVGQVEAFSWRRIIAGGAVVLGLLTIILVTR